MAQPCHPSRQRHLFFLFGGTFSFFLFRTLSYYVFESIIESACKNLRTKGSYHLYSSQRQFSNTLSIPYLLSSSWLKFLNWVSFSRAHALMWVSEANSLNCTILFCTILYFSILYYTILIAHFFCSLITWCRYAVDIIWYLHLCHFVCIFIDRLWFSFPILIY